MHRDGPYRSRLEQDYAAYLECLRLARELSGWQYEPRTFVLPGGVKFTPDFCVLRDGKEEWHEVKGYRVGHVRRREGRTKWRIASGVYPEYRWVWVTRKNKQWVFQTRGGNDV